MKENKAKLIVSTLEDVLPGSMMPYAEYVILDRALPRVEDGLKPVQRRILYTMHELGLSPDKPYKKSARIVGECMGKYHPHGDRSVYDAMVRMAQDFNMRKTLVDGHGNFGSVDGDSAAAMRYTEVKLDHLALELLRDIEKDTVKFNLNFDDSLKEPDTLPGRYPNLLVNGSYGIAVGLATNIPPHNLGEVIDGVIAYIDNPKITLQGMMKHIKGPDFPTGGFLIVNELEKAYETGRGKVTMRANINIEKEDNGRSNIVITELPYQINKANLLKKIADLREEKKDILFGISAIQDESDRNGMRAVIKLKKDADIEGTLAYLIKHTDLECTFGINMVAIAEGKPKTLGLIEIIKYYVEYQREVIYKRTRYDLNLTKERCHIIEGLVIAVRDIDRVIKIIKGAESVPDARNKLRETFDLSERQAQAILDLRLARLTKLEIYKLEEELAELQKLIIKLQAICDSKKLQMDIVVAELKEIKKQYKDDRKTYIINSCDDISVDSCDSLLPTCPYHFVVSEKGSIKKVGEKNYSMTQKTITKKTNLNDIIKLRLLTQSDRQVIAFTNLGNACRIDLQSLNECRLKEGGATLMSVCSEAVRGEFIVAAFEYDENKEGNLLFITKDGNVKKSAWSEYNVGKSYFAAVKLKDKDELITVEDDAPDTTICFITVQGQCLNALKNDIPVQGRVAGGVKGISLNDGDSVVFAEQIDGEGEIIIASSGGLIKRVVSGQIDAMVRYRKGVKAVDLSSGDKVIFASYVKEPYDLAVEYENDVVDISSEDISIESRTHKGRPLNKKKEKFIKIYKYI